MLFAVWNDDPPFFSQQIKVETNTWGRLPGLVTKCEKTKNRKGPVAREVGLQLYQPRFMVDMSIVRSNYKPIRRCSPSPNLRPLAGEADEPWGLWGIP